MTGDVRERTDPGLDFKMQQNGALERFLVVGFFSFSNFFFYLSHKLRLFGGKEDLSSLPPPFLYQNHLSSCRPREYTNCCLCFCFWCMLG